MYCDRLRDTFQLRDPILHLVREAVDRASTSRGAVSADGLATSGGRWARRAKHKYCGGILAGERNFAVVGGGLVDDFSKVVF